MALRPTLDGRLIVVSGASRSGKTAYVMRELQRMKARRVLTWEPDIEPQDMAFRKGWVLLRDARALHAAITGHKAGKFVYSVHADLPGEFNKWAAAVKWWGEVNGGCVAVADELADVTTPGKAPGHWGTLVRRGLKRNITIFAISQRWAEADKTAMGNASEFVVFTARADDIEYMAKKAGIRKDSIEELNPLDYIRRPVPGNPERGRLKF